jgi:hypothetical protein
MLNGWCPSVRLWSRASLAAGSCPCVVKAANRVISDCWYQRQCAAVGVHLRTAARVCVVAAGCGSAGGGTSRRWEARCARWCSWRCSCAGRCCSCATTSTRCVLQRCKYCESSRQGLARGDRKWSLNDARIPNIRVIYPEVQLGTKIFNRELNSIPSLIGRSSGFIWASSWYMNHYCPHGSQVVEVADAQLAGVATHAAQAAVSVSIAIGIMVRFRWLSWLKTGRQ